MPDAFDTLLDASITYLQQLKENGVQYVDVNPAKIELLRRLPERAISAGKKAEIAREKSANQPHERLAELNAKGHSDALFPLTPTLSPGERERRLPLSGEMSGAVQEAGIAESESSRAMTREAKTQAIAQLRERAMQCVKCPHLASSRRNVVFGVGSIEADLMFVGEAPGADEDAAGEPFVGKAGQLLTKIIQTMGLSRDLVYIGNILKCRPDTPGQSAGNRKPTPEEMQTCIPYLHAQIDLIQPKVLVALGATAVEGLLGKGQGITRLRGNWRSYRGIPLMPTYHPAYLLRNQAMSEKRRVWEDMLQVMEKLGMPISEKQRKFFL